MVGHLSSALRVTMLIVPLSDPLLSSALCDLFRSLSQSSEAGVYKALVSSALPELSRIITVPETEATRSQIGAAMTILNSIFDGRPSPLGQGFFAAAADALFTAMARTEDDGVLQEGLECLTFVVRKDVQQLLQWYAQNFKSLPSLPCADNVSLGKAPLAQMAFPPSSPSSLASWSLRDQNQAVSSLAIWSCMSSAKPESMSYLSCPVSCKPVSLAFPQREPRPSHRASFSPSPT